jgi:hypothetical protein
MRARPRQLPVRARTGLLPCRALREVLRLARKELLSERRPWLDVMGWRYGLRGWPLPEAERVRAGAEAAADAAYARPAQIGLSLSVAPPALATVRSPEPPDRPGRRGPLRVAA